MQMRQFARYCRAWQILLFYGFFSPGVSPISIAANVEPMPGEVPSIAAKNNILR